MRRCNLATLNKQKNTANLFRFSQHYQHKKALAYINLCIAAYIKLIIESNEDLTLSETNKEKKLIWKQNMNNNETSGQ